MVYKHAYLNTLLLLHSTFMNSVVKVPLKGEVEGCGLNSHGNYIVDHGKSWKCVFKFLWEPCYMLNDPKITIEDITSRSQAIFKIGILNLWD